MRPIIIYTIIACALCANVLAELQAPPSDSGDPNNSYKDRKLNLMTKTDEGGSSSDSSSTSNSNSNTDSDNNIRSKHSENSDGADSVTSDANSDENTLASLLAEEFSYQGSAIKIIKAPDFTQEKEAQKMTEMLSTLVNSHAKLLKKLENEIEEMDGSIASLGEQPVQAQTQEELELELLYESAMKILNRTRSEKAEGFALLKQAADKGHAKAQAKIAWAQLMGNHVEMDFNAARETFMHLADSGLPDAHMVSTLHFALYQKFKKLLITVFSLSLSFVPFS